MAIFQNTYAPNNKWTRPQCWTQIPFINETEEVIYIPFAVFNDDSNYFACLCSGAYTVDTGDGVVTNVASNTKFEYKYNYVNVNQVCIRGYKTALIKITPQYGQNLTVVNFQQQHSALAANKHTNILEIVANIPNCNSIGNAIGGSTVIHSLLENIRITAGAITNIIAVSYNVTNLKQINITSTTTITLYTTAFINTGLNIIDYSVISSGFISGSISSAFASPALRVFKTGANMSGVTTTTSCFGTSGNYSTIECVGLKIGFSVANQKISATALNNLFTSLGTPATTQTVTVTGNPGAATCDTSIATAKNWTVVIA